MWLKKETKSAPLLPTIVNNQVLTLQRISIDMYYGSSNGKNSYLAVVTYAERPRNSYSDQGVKQESVIEATHWTELRDKIDELLGAAPTASPQQPKPLEEK